jgi:outer membrane protein assembly factor BamB
MRIFYSLFALLIISGFAQAAQNWPQLQGDARRSGNAPEISLTTPLGLVGAVPLTDGIYAAPVVAGGKVFVIDGSGVVKAIDAQTLKVLWTFATRGGPGNCNNVAAPAAIGKYLHVGTMAGYYYVLDQESGRVVREIDCREPILSAPAAAADYRPRPGLHDGGA